MSLKEIWMLTKEPQLLKQYQTRKTNVNNSLPEVKWRNKWFEDRQHLFLANKFLLI